MTILANGHAPRLRMGLIAALLLSLAFHASLLPSWRSKPTPDRKPLIFEQTISFMPYETGWPPSYKLDCLPEPEAFKNQFAWDGKSPPKAAEYRHRPSPPDGCPPDSTEDTIEAEEASFRRQMDQWRWAR